MPRRKKMPGIGQRKKRHFRRSWKSSACTSSDVTVEHNYSCPFLSSQARSESSQVDAVYEAGQNQESLNISNSHPVIDIETIKQEEGSDVGGPEQFDSNSGCAVHFPQGSIMEPFEIKQEVQFSSSPAFNTEQHQSTLQAQGISEHGVLTPLSIKEESMSDADSDDINLHELQTVLRNSFSQVRSYDQEVSQYSDSSNNSDSVSHSQGNNQIGEMHLGVSEGHAAITSDQSAIHRDTLSDQGLITLQQPVHNAAESTSDNLLGADQSPIFRYTLSEQGETTHSNQGEITQDYPQMSGLYCGNVCNTEEFLHEGEISHPVHMVQNMNESTSNNLEDVSVVQRGTLSDEGQITYRHPVQHLTESNSENLTSLHQLSESDNMDSLELGIEEHDNTGASVQERSSQIDPRKVFCALKSQVGRNADSFEPFLYNHLSPKIEFFNLNSTFGGISSIRIHVVIDTDLTPSIFVHHIPLTLDHEIWDGVSETIQSLRDIKVLLGRVQVRCVCPGNDDAAYLQMNSYQPDLKSAVQNNILGYKERYPGLTSNTIRTVDCVLLTKGKPTRCMSCKKYRGTLRKKVLRYQKNVSVDKSATDKREQIQTLQTQNEKLEKELRKIRAQIVRAVSNGEDEENENIEVLSIIQAYQLQLKNSFDKLQKFFWQTQVKYNGSASKHAFSWPPRILTWCVQLQAVSEKAYHFVKNSGFFVLPSDKVLLNYIHGIDIVEKDEHQTVQGQGIGKAESGTSVNSEAFVPSTCPSDKVPHYNHSIDNVVKDGQSEIVRKEGMGEAGIGTNVDSGVFVPSTCPSDKGLQNHKHSVDNVEKEPHSEIVREEGSGEAGSGTSVNSGLCSLPSDKVLQNHIHSNDLVKRDGHEQSAQGQGSEKSEEETSFESLPKKRKMDGSVDSSFKNDMAVG